MADHALLVLLASVAIVMIGFSQSAGDARYFAAKNGYRVDINQESLAQGAANAGAGLFQGIPVSTSLSASSLNDSAGAKTQVRYADDGRRGHPDIDRLRARSSPISPKPSSAP